MNDQRPNQAVWIGLTLMVCWPVIPLLLVGVPLAAALGPGRKRRPR